MEIILSSLVGYIESMAVSNPKLVGIMAAAWSVGFVAKLITGSIEAWVKESPSKEDDLKLENAKKSQVGKAVMFILDLLVRFKKPSK